MHSFSIVPKCCCARAIVVRRKQTKKHSHKWLMCLFDVSFFLTSSSISLPIFSIVRDRVSHFPAPVFHCAPGKSNPPSITHSPVRSLSFSRKQRRGGLFPRESLRCCREPFSYLVTNLKKKKTNEATTSFVLKSRSLPCRYHSTFSLTAAL